MGKILRDIDWKQSISDKKKSVTKRVDWREVGPIRDRNLGLDIGCKLV